MNVFMAQTEENNGGQIIMREQAEWSPARRLSRKGGLTREEENERTSDGIADESGT